MDKQAYLSSQPIVYQVLSKALLHHKLSHAYLLVGSGSCGKEDVALLLAQSYICQHPDTDGYACLVCDDCQRIVSRNYSDMLVIGDNKKILKDDIANLQHFFENTALEACGKRVYIIKNVENATSEALNSLLKFLEEPRENILAILTCESVSTVLPTIVSRCQVLHFKSVKPLVDIDQPWQVWMANQLRKEESIEDIMATTDFQLAMDALALWMDAMPYLIDETLIRIEKECVLDKKASRLSLGYFLEGLYQIYRLHLANKELYNHYFGKIVVFFSNDASALLILRNGIKNCNKTYYLPLVYEQVMIELRKEIKG